MTEKLIDTFEMIEELYFDVQGNNYDVAKLHSFIQSKNEEMLKQCLNKEYIENVKPQLQGGKWF